MAWTTPVDPTSGMTVTKTYMQTYITDNLKAIGAPWTAYVPVWNTAGTAPALNNGTIVGSWLSLGKLVLFELTLTAGTTTTYGTGGYSFTLPVACLSGVRWTFGGQFYDNSAPNIYNLLGITNNTATTTLDIRQAAVSPLSIVTNLAPVTMASQDAIQFNGVYQAA